MSINDASQITEESEEGIQGYQEGQEDQEDCPQVQTMSNSDGIKPSQSLLDTGARLAGSEVEEGEEASQRPTQRPVPSATMTRAAQSNEEDDKEDVVAPPRKKINVCEIMDTDWEQKLVEFFASNPLFYNQTL